MQPAARLGHGVLQEAQCRHPPPCWGVTCDAQRAPLVHGCAVWSVQQSPAPWHTHLVCLPCRCDVSLRDPPVVQVHQHRQVAQHVAAVVGAAADGVAGEVHQLQVPAGVGTAAGVRQAAAAAGHGSIVLVLKPRACRLVSCVWIGCSLGRRAPASTSCKGAPAYTFCAGGSHPLELPEVHHVV
jgi:hypothetical protein